MSTLKNNELWPFEKQGCEYDKGGIEGEVEEVWGGIQQNQINLFEIDAIVSDERQGTCWKAIATEKAI